MREKSILLVEDDEAHRETIKARLSQAYAKSVVFPTSSMLEAYQLYKTQSFDLVILDLNLPDSHGAHSVSEFRSFNRHTPIVVLTGDYSEKNAQAAVEKGANVVLSKTDIMSDQFINTIREQI